MNYITSTQLRSKTSELVKALKEGKSVSFLHRSQIIGVFEPISKEPKKFNAKKVAKIVKSLNLSSTTYQEREKIYRKHLMDKYGKYISGR